MVLGMMDLAGVKRGEITTGGDDAVCIVTVRFQDSGLKEAELLELFRSRNGKVCEIKPYFRSRTDHRRLRSQKGRWTQALSRSG